MRAAHRAHRRRAQRPADRRAARLPVRARPARAPSRRRARRVHLRAARSLSAALGQADRDARRARSAEVDRGAQRRRRPDLSSSRAARPIPYGHRRPARGRQRRRRRHRRRGRPRCATRSMRCRTCCWPKACTRRCRATSTRTKASLQALTEPEAPPEPEIIRTPRSGRVLTFRVALALDRRRDRRAGPPRCRRAPRANPQLNHWLADHLPAPARHPVVGRRRRRGAGVQSLATLGLEPIDVVLMSGDRLGDASSELERYLIRAYRADHAVPDERVTRRAAARADRSTACERRCCSTSPRASAGGAAWPRCSRCSRGCAASSRARAPRRARLAARRRHAARRRRPIRPASRPAIRGSWHSRT